MALYQTKIGAWELRLLRTQCETARLRRKIELIQASLNSGQKPDLVAIDGALELEFLRMWLTAGRSPMPLITWHGSTRLSKLAKYASSAGLGRTTAYLMATQTPSATRRPTTSSPASLFEPKFPSSFRYRSSFAGK